jgi:hypothetical protein
MISRFLVALVACFSITGITARAASILYPSTDASTPSTGNTGVSVEQGKRGIFFRMQCFDVSGRRQTDCWPLANGTPSLRINGMAVLTCANDPTFSPQPGQCSYGVRAYTSGGPNVDTFDIVYNGNFPTNTFIEVTVTGATGNAGSAESTCPNPADPSCTLSFTVEVNPPLSQVYVVLFNQNNITPAGQDVIRAAASQYHTSGSVLLQVTGYTDDSASAGFNLRLSERRAMAVATVLESLGVRRSDMSVSGKGASNPPLNDRVEIVFP